MKHPPVKSLIPNMVTLFGLCAGVTAIRFAVAGDLEKAFFAVLVAAVADGLDGALARSLRAKSSVGAELDSLADMVSFGVAPAVMLYVWVLSDVPRFGWLVCLIYVLCAALRLARFNVTQANAAASGQKNKAFFTGVPMPAAAYLALTPLMLLKGMEDPFFARPELVIPVVLAVAALMVSPIPTFAPRRLKLPFMAALPVFISVAAVAAFMLTDPWLTLAALGSVYLLTVPVSYVMAKK